MKSKNLSLLALGAMTLFSASVAHASLIQSYYATGASGVDAAFENRGGWLQTSYNLPDIITPTGTTSATVLPQVERAVAQLARNNANGLFTPTSQTGIPGVSYSIAGGGVGSGVWQSLTNVSLPTTPSAPFTSFNSTTSRVVPFTFSRTGTVVRYTADGTTWTSSAQNYFSDINSLEFRLRSSDKNAESLTDLIFNNQILPTISAANGYVTIALFSGITAGDFTLTGNFNYTPSPGSAGGWNHQIKGLNLPAAAAIPEPSSLGLVLIGASGLVNACLRRRDRARVT